MFFVGIREFTVFGEATESIRVLFVMINSGVPKMGEGLRTPNRVREVTYAQSLITGSASWFSRRLHLSSIHLTKHELQQIDLWQLILQFGDAPIFPSHREISFKLF